VNLTQGNTQHLIATRRNTTPREKPEAVAVLVVVVVASGADAVVTSGDAAVEGAVEGEVMGRRIKFSRHYVPAFK